MINMKNSQFKLVAASVLAISAFAGLLAPATASAAQVSGVGTLSLDNTALAAASVTAGYPNGWIASKFWDASYNTAAMTGSTTLGGVALPTTGSIGPLVLQANGAPDLGLPDTSCPGAYGSPCVVNNYPDTLNYGRTEQATTMTTAEALTSGGAGHQIGLSGSILLTSPGTTGTLSPYDFRLTKSGASTWYLSTYDTAFGYSNWLKLINVTQSVDINDQLLLSGDLVWTGPWAGLVGANQTAIVGSFNFGAAPAAVPLPGAAWLFGGALSALAAAARRRSVLPA